MMKLLVWVLVCFLSTFGFVYLFCKLSDAPKKISFLNVILFIIGVIFQTFISFYDVTIINTISYFIFFPIMFYALNPIEMKTIIYYVFVIWLYALSLDLIFMLFMMFVNLFIDFDIYGLLAESIVAIMFFISILVLSRVRFIKNFTNNLYIKIKELKNLDIFIIIFLTFVSVIGIVIFFNLDDLSVNVLLYLVLFLILFVFIILIRYKRNFYEIDMYLKNLKENNDFYIRIEDENRIFKHNLMAKLSSIKSVSNRKAISLIDDFVIKTNKNISYSKKVKNIPYGLNGIIYQKTYPYLEDINFKITNKIDFDIFKVLKPRRYNVLVEKLVVSLDNAIEASLNSKMKVVVINLYSDIDNIYIEIKNSFAHNIDVDNLGTLNYSTKGKKRGLGLFSILRDNEASLNFKVINNYFISLISAKKQK